MRQDFKIFLAAALTIAVLICAGMCMAVRSEAQIANSYAAYVAFLTLSSLIGGGAVSFASALLRHGAARENAAVHMRVHELEKALASLEDAAEKREEFIASFAHELKTPLTAIIGYADMLRSKDMAPKPRFTAAGYIFSEGRRLEALSLKLMDIIVAGKSDFERRRMDAGYFIRDVAAVSVPSTGGDGLTLDMRWDRGEVAIEPDLFKTLLINLVDNARKASRKGQKVELYGKREEGGYAFYVKDYGRGMNPEEIEKITEPFYVIDKSRSRSQNGAGLGLAICQRIAELHGSKLEYESSPGKGTTVRVFLREGGQ